MNTINNTGINKKFINPNNLPEIDTIKSSFELAKYDRLSNANKLKTFGGKRFLGLTPRGKPVYVKYNINRSNKSIDISFTHELSILLKDNAKLANDRYSWAANTKVSPSDYARMTDKLRKAKSKEVTKQTLHWLVRLKMLVDIQYYKAYVKSEPTLGLIQYITHSIFTGTYQTHDTPSWNEIVETWKFPNGPYFNPEETWSYPDVL